MNVGSYDECLDALMLAVRELLAVRGGSEAERSRRMAGPMVDLAEVYDGVEMRLMKNERRRRREAARREGGMGGG